MTDKISNWIYTLIASCAGGYLCYLAVPLGNHYALAMVIIWGMLMGLLGTMINLLVDIRNNIEKKIK